MDILRMMIKPYFIVICEFAVKITYKLYKFLWCDFAWRFLVPLVPYRGKPNAVFIWEDCPVNFHLFACVHKPLNPIRCVKSVRGHFYASIFQWVVLYLWAVGYINSQLITSKLGLIKSILTYICDICTVINPYSL